MFSLYPSESLTHTHTNTHTHTYTHTHTHIFFIGFKLQIMHKDFNKITISDVLLNKDLNTVVKVLCYKSEGRWFDPRWCQWFRSHYGLGVDSVSNRNEYQEHFLEVKAAGA